MSLSNWALRMIRHLSWPSMQQLGKYVSIPAKFNISMSIAILPLSPNTFSLCDGSIPMPGLLLNAPACCLIWQPSVLLSRKSSYLVSVFWNVWLPVFVIMQQTAFGRGLPVFPRPHNGSCWKTCYRHQKARSNLLWIGFVALQHMSVVLG